MIPRNRFRADTGCYACCVCSRMTRDTGDNGALRQCPECAEVSGLENEIQDCGDPTGAIAARIAELERAAVSKGGRIPGVSS